MTCSALCVLGGFIGVSSLMSKIVIDRLYVLALTRFERWSPLDEDHPHDTFLLYRIHGSLLT